MNRVSIPMRPKAWERPRFNGSRGYEAQSAKDAKATIQAAWIEAHGIAPLSGPIRMYVEAEFAAPKLSKAKRQALIGTWYEHTPDVDNLWKLVGDALQGIAYADDKRIVDAGISKTYADADCLKISIGPAHALPKQQEDGW